MSWSEEVKQHEAKIRRHAYLAGIFIGVVLTIVAVYVVSCVIEISRL